MRHLLTTADLQLETATALDPAPITSVIAQNVAHRLGSHGEKMCTVAGVDSLLIDELEIGLVNQCRGVQRQIAVPAAPLTVCKSAQLVVDEREQLAQRGPIPRLQFVQELRDGRVRRVDGVVLSARRERTAIAAIIGRGSVLSTGKDRGAVELLIVGTRRRSVG